MTRRLTVRPAVRPLRLASTFAILTAGLILGGCQGSGPPPAPAGPYELGAQATPTPGSNAGATAVNAPRGKTGAPIATAAEPPVPLDAKYTIVCSAFNGDDHVKRAKAWKDAVTQATGRREFYLVHEEATSTLYFGYYRDIEHNGDAKEAKRADADLAFVRGLADGENHLLFPGALKEPLPVADPEGPPEFDLTKLDADKAPDDPTRRFWSIAIAAYTADGNFGGADAHKSRKELAIESVIECRKHNIEAYYYNGQNVSTVCIGAWPRTALMEQEANQAQSTSDNGQDILVSSTPLPKAMTDEIIKSGRNIKVVQPKVELNSTSTISTVWKQFPDYSVNGYVKVSKTTDPKTGVVTEKPQSSFLFEIPKPVPAGLPAARVASDAQPTAADLANPLLPNSGAGRLRSVTP